MQLRDFYELSGADYDSLLRRFGGNELFVRKYLGKFLEDQNFTELKSAIALYDYDQVLKAAHTLKGICMNLDLRPLGDVCAEIVSSIRAGQQEHAAALFKKAEQTYLLILKELEGIL